jgi:hypothetical protein
MERYNIFCTKNNLLHILNEYDNLRLESENPEDLLTITQLYSLLTNKNSYLALNMTSEEFEELGKKNIVIKNLIRKSHSDSNIILDYKTDFFEEDNQVFTQIAPNSLLFLDQTKEQCEQLSDEYGLIFLCKENLLQKINLIFSWALYNVTKDKKAIQSFKNWKELQKFKHPFNAMIVVDNYILDDTKSLYNLKDLLNNFLPNTLEKQIFHLTIITNNQKTIRSEGRIHEKQKYDLDKKCQELNTEISSLRSYKINLSLILIDSDKNHDRNIFTNYFWLHSGHSFDYFSEKGEVTNPTNLMIFPIFYQQDKTSTQQNTVYEAVYQLLQEIKFIVDNSATQSERNEKRIIEKNACGNKQNRLLE